MKSNKKRQAIVEHSVANGTASTAKRLKLDVSHPMACSISSCYTEDTFRRTISECWRLEWKYFNILFTRKLLIVNVTRSFADWHNNVTVDDMHNASTELNPTPYSILLLMLWYCGPTSESPARPLMLYVH